MTERLAVVLLGIAFALKLACMWVLACPSI